jgi:hypothetical protein
MIKGTIKLMSASLILTAAAMVAFSSGGLVGVLAWPAAFSAIGAIYRVS